MLISQILDLAVNVGIHEIADSPSTQHGVRFEAPHTLYCGTGDAPAGRLADYGGALLQRLVADDELVLQLILFSAPIAPTTERDPGKDASKYLGVTIYGPRRRFSDVGDFVTKAGCYLDDPVSCNRNVPYMNPQCLFSLYERPPMTFDLPQLQDSHSDSFPRAPLEVLSGFRTSDEFELAANPIDLHTESREYETRREIREYANSESQASETSP